MDPYDWRFFGNILHNNNNTSASASSSTWRSSSNNISVNSNLNQIKEKI